MKADVDAEALMAAIRTAPQHIYVTWRFRCETCNVTFEHTGSMRVTEIRTAAEQIVLTANAEEAERLANSFAAVRCGKCGGKPVAVHTT